MNRRCVVSRMCAARVVCLLAGTVGLWALNRSLRSGNVFYQQTVARPTWNVQLGRKSSDDIIHTEHEEEEDSEIPNKLDFFNCARKEAICRFFRPRHFFQNGLGKVFMSDYERIGGMNLNLPSCTSFAWWSQPGSTEDNFFEHSHVPYNLTFVHMHKCGGTTVKTTMHDLAIEMSKGSRKSSITNHRYQFGGGSKRHKDENKRKRDEHIAAIMQAQRKGLRRQAFPVFTLVRDPVDRFMSGVQQVMHYNEIFRDKCLKRTAMETLKCAIKDVDETNYRRDVHLLPMASHLRIFDDHDITVSVFLLEDMKTVLRYLGASSGARHIHDRSQVEFATSQVLSKMSVSDCDEDMIRSICRLYAVDVAMMQTMGHAVPLCNTS